MKKTIILLLTLIYASAIWADSSQLLVYRKSGEVNLFFIDKLLHIENSNIDINGNSREDVCSQRFVFSDTTVIIPVADIDSVAFNGRNAIKAKAEAREILKEHLKYIESYDGTSIMYKSNAPSEILPAYGEKIFYNGFSEQFPYGLCAQVNQCSYAKNGYKCEVTEISPDQVFDQYFVAGDFELEIPIPADAPQKATAEFGHIFELKTDNPEFKSKGVVKLRVENFVASLTTGFYHADIYTSIDYDFGLKAKIDPSAKISGNTIKITIFRGTIGGVVQPRFDVSLFWDIAASLSFDIELHRNSELHYKWTRLNGQNTFKMAEKDNEQKETNESKLAILLNGEVFFGALFDLTLSTLFERIGVGVSAKLGPEIKGDFGFESAYDLTRDYNAETYLKAQIEFCQKCKIETYAYHYSNFLNGEVEKTELPFGVELSETNRTIDLLPHFSSWATRMTSTTTGIKPTAPFKAVDIASSTANQLAAPLEIGFELTDKNTGKTLVREFTESVVEANSEESQGFNHILNANYIDIDNVEARPIVKYADYILKCPPTEISSGATLTPMFCTASTQSAFIVGGQAIIGQTETDDLNIIVGNHMPTVGLRPGFDSNWKPRVLIHDPGNPNAPEIYGTWTGSYMNQNLALVLNRDETAKYNGENAKFKLDTPANGQVYLCFEDNRTLVFDVLELEQSSMKIKLKPSNIEISLSR